MFRTLDDPPTKTEKMNSAINVAFEKQAGYYINFGGSFIKKSDG